MMKKTHALKIVASVATMFALTSCGTYTISKDVSSEGKAGEVIFPGLDSIVMKEGTFPNRANLRSIGSGMTKDQLYDLIGRPHFREAFHAHEWDYLFNFRQPDGSVVRCQYKVIFDKDYLGQSFHWLPAGCADQLVMDKPASAVASTSATPVQLRRINLNADALFAFNRFGRDDILPGGREQIVALAQQLKSTKASLIQVVGHTDRIGGEVANAVLSQRRAETVRALMVENGVDANTISALGMGEALPVKECSDSLARAELISCLQPNRRVEIVIAGLSE